MFPVAGAAFRFQLMAQEVGLSHHVHEASNQHRRNFSAKSSLSSPETEVSLESEIIQMLLNELPENRVLLTSWRGEAPLHDEKPMLDKLARACSGSSTGPSAVR